MVNVPISTTQLYGIIISWDIPKKLNLIIYTHECIVCTAVDIFIVLSRYNNLHIHYNLSIKSIVMFLLSSLGQPSTGVSMREIGIKSYEWTRMPIKKKESPNIYNEQVIPPENETHSHQFWCNGALHGLELNSWEGDWFIQYLLTLQYKQCW